MIYKAIGRSLVAKIALLVLFAVGVGFALSVLISTQVQIRSLDRIHTQSARSLSRSVSAGVRNAMLSGKGITVEQMLAEARKELEGAEVRVFAPNGEEVFSPHNTEPARMAPPPDHVFAALAQGTTQIAPHDARATPIPNRDDCRSCHTEGDFRGVLTLGLSGAPQPVNASPESLRALADAVNEGFVQLMSAEQLGQLTDYFDNLAQATPGLRAAGVFDAEGDIVFGADVLQELPAQHVQAALQPGAITTLPTPDTVLIPLPNDARCRSCHANQPGPRGVLAVRFDPAQLEPTESVRGVVQVSLDHAMPAGLGRLIITQLDALGRSGLVSTLTLHDADGHLFHEVGAEMDPPEHVREALDSKQSLSRTVETDDESAFIYVEALENEVRCQTCHGTEDELRGVIEVRLDTSDARDERDSLQQRSIVFALGTVGLIVLLLYGGLRRTVLRPVRAIGDVAARVGSGALDARVEVRSRDEIGQLGERINEMVEGLRQKLALSKFVSRETLREVEREGDAQRRGRRTTLTVLFSDIRGFTAFSERHEPEEVVDMLNRYLQVQADVVVRYGGDIDKFVGDELMARFDGPDMAERASRAAVEMIEAVEALNATYAHDIAIGVGINLGEVVLGAMGAEERMDFTVIGDGVNLGARLCSAAPPRTVLVSRAVRDALDPATDLQAEPLEPIQVKGKSEPIDIFSVTRKTS